MKNLPADIDTEERTAEPAVAALVSTQAAQTVVSPSAVPVSIIIKAFNEENNIEAAIEHALNALATVGGEVILADSCSTDRTVELASAFPIRIVTLTNAQERCCGIGPQLGYQYSRGQFVYLLDGDMKMRPDFLKQAVGFLEQHPRVAGVGGRLLEHNTTGLEYQARLEREAAHSQAGEVDRLDGGGLYRREAIEQIGYLSNRNLHSYEEIELAVRLLANGWKLWRLDVDAIDHRGHDSPDYQLLARRWRSGYAQGVGEVTRAAIHQGNIALLWRQLRELRLYVAVVGWWIVIVAALLLPMAIASKALLAVAVALTPLAAMSLRKRSFRKGLFSVVSWCVNAAGLLKGLTRARREPSDKVDAIELKSI